MQPEEQMENKKSVKEMWKDILLYLNTAAIALYAVGSLIFHRSPAELTPIVVALGIAAAGMYLAALIILFCITRCMHRRAKVSK